MYDNRQTILGGNPTVAIEAYRFVTYGGTSGDIQKSVAGEQSIGISSDCPAAATDTRADYVVLGPHRVRVAAAVTQGQSLISDADGSGVVAGAGVWSIARAIEDGAAGDVVQVLVAPHTTV